MSRTLPILAKDQEVVHRRYGKGVVVAEEQEGLCQIKFKKIVREFVMETAHKNMKLIEDPKI